METAAGSVAESVVSKAPKMNAFQLLMSGRNKSLGTNSDGKKSLPREAQAEDEPKSAKKDSKNEKLKKWADEKGAAKRKREYAARGEVIDIKLEERAKRLKTMLKVEENGDVRNGQSSKPVECKKPKNGQSSKPAECKEPSKSKNKKKSKPVEKKPVESKKSSRLSEKNKKTEQEQSEASCEEETKDCTENKDVEDLYSEKECSDGEKLGASFTKKSWKMRIKLKLGDDFQCSKTGVKEAIDKEELEESIEDLEGPKEDCEDVEVPEKDRKKMEVAPKSDCKIEAQKNVECEDVELQKSDKGEEEEAQNMDEAENKSLAEEVNGLEEELDELMKEELEDRMKQGGTKIETLESSGSAKQVKEKVESGTESNDDEVVKSRRSKSTVIVSSDESSQENPTEPTQNSSTGRVLRPRRSKPVIVVESCSSDDEEFDSSSSPKKEKTQKNVKQKPKKMAPVFQRAQQANPEAVEARRAFLLSGMPDCIQQKVDAEKPLSSSDPSGYSEFHLEYPEITSVPQAVSTLPKADLNLPPFRPLTTPSVPSCKNCLLLQQQIPKHKITSSSSSSNAQAENDLKIDRNVELAVLKESHPELPVERFYKYARQMHKNGDETQIWTDKYQARKVKHLLKNYTSIGMLSDWLKNFNERRKQTSGSSGSDFIVSDGEDDANGGLTGNSVVLSGPSGCGKSNALYAICTDLGLDVLEVNASSKRTGKWLLHELQEATQSHQLNKKANDQNATLAANGWLSSGNVAKPKKKKKQEKEQKEATKAKQQKMCVLFVEDVDVIFDQDDGFVGALKEIVCNSKRPVVMTTTDEDSPNVKKLMWKSIRFEPASIELLSIWLKVICIVEGLHADVATLGELLTFNKRDLRQTLLQLQLRAGSANSADFKRVENLELLYWNFPKILALSSSSENDDKTKLTKLCSLYDSVILADGILKRSHESLERPLRHAKDSLVLEENFEPYGDRLFDEELARSLIECGLKNYGVERLDLDPISEGWRSKRKSMEILDQVVRPSTSYAARNLDYMACLCAIAKSEKKRAAASRSKRRFDHFFSTHLDLSRQNWDSICDILNKNRQK